MSRAVRLWAEYGALLPHGVDLSIPYVHRLQYFEMPLLGLFGYVPFGIECLVVTDAWMKRMSSAY